MQVKNENDRIDMPEECDFCQSNDVFLERYYHSGPSHNIDWVCKYCECDFSRGKNDIIKSIAAMFNLFEKSLFNLFEISNISEKQSESGKDFKYKKQEINNGGY